MFAFNRSRTLTFDLQSDYQLFKKDNAPWRGTPMIWNESAVAYSKALLPAL